MLSLPLDPRPLFIHTLGKIYTTKVFKKLLYNMESTTDVREVMRKNKTVVKRIVSFEME